MENNWPHTITFCSAFLGMLWCSETYEQNEFHPKVNTTQSKWSRDIQKVSDGFL